MAGTYLDVEDQKKSEREREVNVDLKVKLGHKSHREFVRVCHVQGQMGRVLLAQKTGMTNRTIVEG
jgi:hypothetical protein